jgi:hypothetical protein
MKPKTQLQKKPPKNTQPTKKKKKKNPADTVARGATRAGADEKTAGKPTEVAESAGEATEGARAR